MGELQFKLLVTAKALHQSQQSAWLAKDTHTKSHEPMHRRHSEVTCKCRLGWQMCQGGRPQQKLAIVHKRISHTMMQGTMHQAGRWHLA